MLGKIPTSTVEVCKNVILGNKTSHEECNSSQHHVLMLRGELYNNYVILIKVKYQVSDH